MLSMRIAIIVTSALLGLIVLTSYWLIIDHAATYVDSDVPPCSFSQFDPNCSPSGWMGFLLGDLVIAIGLGFFLHYMGARSYDAMTRTMSDVKNILEITKKAKRRRTIFMSQAMRNHFGVLLIAMGLMNRLLSTAKSYDDIASNIDEQREHMTRTTQRALATLTMSVDLLDLSLISDMAVLIEKIESTKIESGVGEGFPNYNKIKVDIKDCIDRLDKSVSYDAVIK